MKRPFAVIGFSYCAALAAALLSGVVFYPYFAAFFLIGLIVSLAVKPIRKSIYVSASMLSALTAMIMLSVFTTTYAVPAGQLTDQTAIVTAEVCDLPYESGERCYYKLHTRSIALEQSVQDTTILVSCADAIDCEPYDILEAEVTFYSVGEGSYRFSAYSGGIFARGTINHYKPVSVTHTDHKPLYYYALTARKAITDMLRDLLPHRQFSFVNALLTADSSFLSDSDLRDLRTAGLSYVIVVSGFHVSFVAALVFSLCRLLALPKRRTAVPLCIAFVFVYMAIAGFSPSVVRAGIMNIIYYIGYACFKKPDSLNSLGFSALILCVLNPFTVAGVSFLLSFSATLGIILFAEGLSHYLYYSIIQLQFYTVGKLGKLPLLKLDADMTRIKTRRSKIVMAIMTAVSVSVSAFLFSLPVYAIFFGNVPLYSVFAGLITEPAVMLAMISAVLMLLFTASGIFSFLALPFTIAAGVSVNFILAAANWIAALPFAKVTVSFFLIILWSGMVLFLILILRRSGIFSGVSHKAYRRQRICIVLAVSVFLSGTTISYAFRHFGTRLAVLDTGEGISALLTKNDQVYMLSCGGSPYKSAVLRQYIEHSNIDTIRILVAVDTDNNTSAYANTVLSSCHVATAAVYQEESLDEHTHSLLLAADHLLPLAAGSSHNNIIQDGSVSIHTMITDECNAVYADTQTLTVLLLYDGTDCSALPQQYRSGDVLVFCGKTAHTELLHYTNVIISNTADALPRYAAPDYSGLYTTSGSGNIIVTSYGQNRMLIGRESPWLS